MQNDFGWISSAYILGYENDLIRSLGDAYRLPSYVIYQSLFVMLFERPIIAIKISQIILSSSFILIAFYISNYLNRSNIASLIASFFIALWFPLHFYSLDLTGVTFSIFIYSLFVWALFKLFDNHRHNHNYSHNFSLIIIGLLLGVITLSKSNNILIFIPLFFTLWYFYGSIKIAIINCIKSGLIFLIVVLPWSYFISSHNNTIILTSVLGPQALLSYSGLRKMPMDTILGKVDIKYKIYSELDYKQFRDDYNVRPNFCKSKITEYLLNNNNPYKDHQFSISTPECYDWNDYSQTIKLSSQNLMDLYYKRWSENTHGFIMYGFAKIAHGFGASLRGISDYLSLLLFGFSLGSSIYLWKKSLYRSFVVFYWSTLLAFSVNSFILIGYVRYRVIFFDFSAVLLIGLMVASICIRKKTISIDVKKN